MASSNSLSNRLEELRSRNPQSPPGEGVFSGYSNPNRYSGSFLSSNSQHMSNDARNNLQRRPAADANPAPLMSPIGFQAGSILDNVDLNTAQTYYKVQAMEKKRLEIEKTREQRRRFDAELEKFNRLQAQEEKELEQMAHDLAGMQFSPGHLSEPTTPPEYREQPAPQMYPRHNRYSSTGLASPPGMNQRNNRSGSQVTSPPGERMPPHQNSSDTDSLPSKSVPGSRRGSTDRFSAYISETIPSSRRRATTNNRYSLPAQASAKERDPHSEAVASMGLGHINTTSFLFGDEDEKSHHKEMPTSPDIKNYLQMNTTEDKFPILIRNNHKPGTLSVSSAALDLALSQNPSAENKSNGWPSFARHRPGQQSLPQNIFDPYKSPTNTMTSPTTQKPIDSLLESPPRGRNMNRLSMDASLSSFSRNSGIFGQPPTTTAAPRPNLAAAHSSFSTNDIPTLKSPDANGANGPVSPPSSQQRFHNHNASLGRIPASALNNRLSRELSNGDMRRDEAAGGLRSPSELQASAAPFGPATSASSPTEALAGTVGSPNMPQFANGNLYNSYGVNMLNMGLTPLQLSQAGALNNPMALYQAQQNPYNFYAQYGQAGRMQENQARALQQRRMQNAEDVARFTNAKIENYVGEIYSLCKDQHGCRYLQKQLEARNAETTQMIFLETCDHVTELMTDPFGNYLCQKLLEHADDAQRTVLVNNSAPEMVKIALNQHGTRALQKLIEFISTREQIQTVIFALKDKVVELIQDLNGNHVIQKCLNRLSSEDAQFIFDAVGANCVVVGTHRHGCCVLQRCIDHASAPQKKDLVAQITKNAFALVQDPFGNYVLQYIVDLNDPSFTEPLCYSFQGNIGALSKQKFSSNVIEKCLRHGGHKIARMMVEEMLGGTELERMLRDSYANYVVQTALEHADTETKELLIDGIRPILPSIRGTPYGRRIQTKILGQTDQGNIGQVLDVPQPAPANRGRTNGNTAPFANNVPTSNGFSNPAQGLFSTESNPLGQAQFRPQAPGNAQSQSMPNGTGSFVPFSGSIQNPMPQMPNYGRNPQPGGGFNYF